MTEEYILHLIPTRIKQLGYKKYHIHYKDFFIRALSSVRIEAFNELYFVIGDPQGIVIESDYGIYDSTGLVLCDNEHQHKGEITLSNPGNDDKRVKFIQVIIVY
jgi:hypothetical protein